MSIRDSRILNHLHPSRPKLHRAEESHHVQALTLVIPVPPNQGIDASIMEENRKLIADIDRRKILRGGLTLGALTMLTGCNVTQAGA